MSEQEKDISVPQVNQESNRGIEQGRNMIPKHVGSPQVTEIQTPFYPDPVMKPPPRPPDKIAQNDRQINLDLDLEINKDFEENSPYQEEGISEIYQRPDKLQLVEPPELTDLVDTDKIVQKYLPKQTDICHRSHRDARWIGGLSQQSSNLSHLCYLLQKVVVCACSNTRFEWHKVVNKLANLQTT